MSVGYHAGLMHTYGYLLSSLKTRFGYKHETLDDRGNRERAAVAEGGIFTRCIYGARFCKTLPLWLAALRSARGPRETKTVAECIA